MPLYRYVKADPVIPRAQRRGSRVVSFSLIGFGGAILAWVLWPILSFSVISSDLFAQTVTPIQDSFASAKLDKNVGSLSPVVFAASNTAPAGSDFTNANAWFPTAPQKKVVTPVTNYLLSIPKLKLIDAEVTVA